MIKLVILVLSCMTLGCHFRPADKYPIVVDIISDTNIVVCGKKFDMPAGYWMNDEIITKILLSDVRRLLSDGHGRTVLLKTDGCVQYGCLWSIIWNFERFGCNVDVVSDGGSIKVLTTPIFGPGLDCYFIDNREMRSFNCIATSFVYESGDAIRTARTMIAKRRQDSPTLLQFRCYCLMLARDFLDVLPVVREKGFDTVYLGFPLGQNISECVDDFLNGIDGL